MFSRRWDPQPPQTTHRPSRLKPLTPLLAQNSQIQAIFHPQRCHGFHAPLAEHPQRRRRFHETPNRSAGSQKGAQTLMLAAAVTLLIASEQFDSKEMP